MLLAWRSRAGSRVAAAIAAVWTTAVTVALGAYGLATRQAGWGVVAMSIAGLGTLAAAPALDHGWLQIVAAVVLVAGSARVVVVLHDGAARRGHAAAVGDASELVIAGPYRIVRNPMAVAGVLQVAAIGALVGSWTVIAAAFAGAVAWHVIIRPTEEADLAARFGEPYESYRSTVRCWIPRNTPSSPGPAGSPSDYGARHG